MLNNVLNKINVSTRLLILFLISLSLLISNSIYFIMLLLVFLIILIVITNKSVKLYINLIKNVKFLLLFIIVTYIIVVGSISNIFILCCKLILIILFIGQFFISINFNQLVIGIKTLIKPLDKIFNSNKFACELALFIYFMKYYISSKQYILDKYSGYSMLYLFSFKYNILPRLFYSFDQIKTIETSTKMKHSVFEIETNNKISTNVLIAFIIFFIVVIFKEVIL